MAPVGLKHWMLHNDQLANEYDETLKLSPGYDPVRAVDPALTFHAPLLTGPDSIPGAIRATFERNSEATYQAPRGAFLLTAGDDESRHEYTPDDEPLGVLMEPASTNKCINYNADAQALNMFLGGDPTATLSSVEDREALHAAGLNRVVGKVYKLDNSLGSSFAHANPDGPPGNTNQHIVQAYWRGTGQGEIRLSGVGAGAEMVPSQYTLEWNALIPAAAFNRLEVRAQPGAVIYFTLNQLEESKVPSSVIVTEGAATSRAVDQLSWPLAGGPYGSETVLNGNFNDGTANWQSGNSADLSIVDGRMRVTNGAVDFGYAEQQLDVTGFDWIRLRGKYRRGTSTQGIFRIASVSGTGNLLNHVMNDDQDVNLGVNVAPHSTIYISLWNNNNDLGRYSDFDDVSVRGASPILNQAEGMHAVIWRPSFGAEVPGPNESQRITSMATALFYFHNRAVNGQIIARSGTTTEILVDLPDPLGVHDYVIALWWNGADWQLGVKTQGAWVWSVVASNFAGFTEAGLLLLSDLIVLGPAHCRKLSLWTESRGAAWLEKYFEKDAK